jgi:hypothetical protein
MPIQKCPMCLETKNVVSSHLIPARVYDYMRGPAGHPIAMNSQVVMASDRELQFPLLCAECEDCLNKGGEMWLLPLLATYEGPFPFHDLVTKFEPDEAFKGARGYYTGKNPEIQADRVAHFAMGIFWKAAVHSWRGGTTASFIELGPYAEKVRKFLRGETGFPKHMILTVGVLPKPVKAISCNLPFRGSNTAWFNYLFYVCGIEFALEVGKMIPPEAAPNCFAANPLHPLVLFDFSEDIRMNFNRVWNKAKKAKNLVTHLQNLKK